MAAYLSPEQIPSQTFYSRIQYSCSCSALPIPEDNLNYTEAAVLIERPKSQSYFHEKVASLQQRIQSLRPISQSTEKPRRELMKKSNHRRAQSALPTPSFPQYPPASRHQYSDRERSNVPSSLQLGDASQLQPTRAQIANCLPPDHLDPPPDYWQASTPIQLIHPVPRSRSVILQPQDDELFLDPDFPTLSNSLAVPIITHNARVGTPNSFELEYWATMDEAG